MKIYHLSHTDLDGYSCQFVSSFYLKNVEFYNSNYGKEIDKKMSHIISKIGDEKAVILITDLNLTKVQCQSYEEQLKGKDVKLILLDHHQTGAECAREFSWYYLDNSRSATKICYDFFSAMFGADERLGAYCDVVNAVDIWLKDDPNFELGKVCMGAIAGAKEINKVMFEDEHIEYIFYLMRNFCEFLSLIMPILSLTIDSMGLKKSFFILKMMIL